MNVAMLLGYMARHVSTYGPLNNMDTLVISYKYVKVNKKVK